MKAAPRRRRRGSLDAELIVQTAFALAGEVGLSALTVPQVAERLDAPLTSLYWHFRTKESLLAAMSAPAVDQLAGMMLRPGDSAPEQWRSFLRAYFVNQRQVYQEHPLLTDLTVMRRVPHSRAASRAGFAGVEVVLQHLVGAGFDHATAWFSYATLELFTQGTVVSERSRHLRGEPLPGHQHLAQLHPGDLPVVSSVIAADTEGIFLDFTGGAGFDFGLDAILDGVERKLRHRRQP